MDDYYQILEFLYKFNKKVPDIRFGQLVETLYNKNIEDFYHISNEEFLKRLKQLYEDI